MFKKIAITLSFIIFMLCSCAKPDDDELCKACEDHEIKIDVMVTRDVNTSDGMISTEVISGEIYPVEKGETILSNGEYDISAKVISVSDNSITVKFNGDIYPTGHNKQINEEKKYEIKFNDRNVFLVNSPDNVSVEIIVR